MSSFVVLTPSRGLVHSRVIESVMANIASASAAGHEFRGWRLTHDRPIPECDEEITIAGLGTGADLLWFVEEDTVPPSGALLDLIALAVPIAAIDYPVGEAPSWACVARDREGHIYWCGLGCTLIRRQVFEAIERPWFRCDVTYSISPGPDGRKVLHEMDRPSTYGGQDIYFFRRALAHGFAIAQVSGRVAGHAKVRELGARETNQGWHRIEVLTRIEREQFV